MYYDNPAREEEARIRRSLGSVGDQCELNVINSDSKEFKGVFNCKEGDSTTVHINAIDSTRQKISILYNTSELGETTANATAQWKGATCPEYLKEFEDPAEWKTFED